MVRSINVWHRFFILVKLFGMHNRVAGDEFGWMVTQVAPASQPLASRHNTFSVAGVAVLD